MFGNVLNNSHIIKLLQSNQLIISNFDETRLKLAHYALRPAGVLTPGRLDQKGARQMSPKHNFEYQGEYPFQPNEYAVIEIKETIILPDGIVGHFLPTSSLIEQGFGLVAGKLDPGYGKIKGHTQKIIVGLKNLKSEVNPLSPEDRVAHVYFVDLRGLNNIPFNLPQEDLEMIMRRISHFQRARDDGPRYPDDE